MVGQRLQPAIFPAGRPARSNGRAAPLRAHLARERPNFAPARLRDGDGKLHADGSGFGLELPADLTARLRPYTGHDVIVGVRPEDLQVANGSAPPGLCFDAMVEVVERLGAEVLLDLQVGQQTMVASVEPTVAARRGDKLRFALKAERLHFFDATSEAAI